MCRLCSVLCNLLAILVTSAAGAELTSQSGVDDILDALDARGRGLKSLTMDVKLTDTNPDTGDATTRTGKVWYEQPAAGSARIRVAFDKKEANGRIIDDKIEYLLEGSDLIDRTYRTKTQVTRRVLKPGEQVNLLKLGEGPFPLPIGQKKEDVHAMFEVKRIDPSRDDPSDTIHLQLLPRAGSRFERRFKSIDVWVDLKSHMPRQIETLDRNESTTRTTDLSNVVVNPKLGPSDFELPKVSADDWQLIDEAFQD